MLFLRTFVHLFGVVVLVSLILVFIGVLMTLNDQNKLEEGGTWEFIGNFLIYLTTGAYGAVFVGLLYCLLRSLISPFRFSTALTR